MNMRLRRSRNLLGDTLRLLSDRDAVSDVFKLLGVTTVTRTASQRCLHTSTCLRATDMVGGYNMDKQMTMTYLENIYTVDTR